VEKKYLAPVDLSHHPFNQGLQLAVKEGDTRLTLLLISHGAEVNWKDSNDNDFTALHVAIMEGHIWLADLLIQNGVDINITDSNGWTALHHAAFLNKIDAIILLIRRGAKLSLVDNQSRVS
jgi:ankyrin repeat protein